ncbi:2699_t:CDS:2 [Funneliformis caledonium]|uniref:2699_t:CDS:1 n=1 Tax=Funneliformis caledonium TaxID=1117310 RepID=A0A9N8V467_9GLOM|nr:2699_t:CDS:2 [Funneliformis caledonium]
MEFVKDYVMVEVDFCLQKVLWKMPIFSQNREYTVANLYKRRRETDTSQPPLPLPLLTVILSTFAIVTTLYGQLCRR